MKKIKLNESQLRRLINEMGGQQTVLSQSEARVAYAAIVMALDYLNNSDFENEGIARIDEFIDSLEALLSKLSQ